MVWKLYLCNAYLSQKTTWHVPSPLLRYKNTWKQNNSGVNQYTSLLELQFLLDHVETSFFSKAADRFVKYVHLCNFLLPGNRPARAYSAGFHSRIPWITPEETTGSGQTFLPAHWKSTRKGSIGGVNSLWLSRRKPRVFSERCATTAERLVTIQI